MADFTKELIEDLFDREFDGRVWMGELIESDISFDGARDGEIGWWMQSKVNRGFDG